MSILLEFSNVTAGNGGAAALKELNFSVKSGEFLALAGPNGSGKTTLLKTACGLIPPLSGEVKLGGKNVRAMSEIEKAGRAAILFQTAVFAWPFTVAEIVSQGAFARRRSKQPSAGLTLQEALSETGLEGYEERLITKLSGGEVQRVLLARSLLQNAPLLLLDEPVSGLDPKYKYAVMNLTRRLARKGYGVLMSLHDLNLASIYADRIALLSSVPEDAGSIAYMGSPSEVLKPNILSEIYGLELPVGKHISNGGINVVFPPLAAENGTPPPR